MLLQDWAEPYEIPSGTQHSLTLCNLTRPSILQTIAPAPFPQPVAFPSLRAFQV